MYYFLSGYTAKVAGTERGVKEPTGDVLLLLRRGVPRLASDEVRRDARPADRRARLPRVAREHRLERRPVRRRQAHEARATRARWCTPSSTARSTASRRARIRCSGSPFPTRCPTSPPTCSIRAARGPTRPRTTRRRRSWPRCSARTSRSSATSRQSIQSAGPQGLVPARATPPPFAHVVRGHPRSALEQHPRRSARAAARRHACVPAAALRAAARAGVSRLSRREPLALRARARRVPPRAPRARRCSRSAASRSGSRADECLVVRCAALLHDIGHYPFSHALEEIGALHHEEVARPLITTRRGRRRPARRARRRRARAHHGAHPRAQRQPAAGAHLRLARPRQDRVPQARRLHVRRELRRHRRRPAAQLAHRRRRSRARRPRRRRVREGTVRARVAAVREVSDVPQRVLAPRRAQRDGDVQATRGRRAARRLARAPRRSPRSPTRDCCTSSRSARRRRCSPRCASAGSTSASSSAPPPSCPRSAASGSPTTARSSSPSRISSRASSDSRPASCCSTIRSKTQMLGLDIPVLRRNGSVRRLTAEGWEGAINLPTLSEELYRSARWLRVFACRPVR